MTQTLRSRERNHSIDALRGLVMILMALDHTRDFFTSTGFNPTDLSRVSGFLFLTRWVTHLCAPVFIFLTGTGAYLSFSRTRNEKALFNFLATRGLWLVLLELTVIQLAWRFTLNYHDTALGVIWAIGWSMVFLALLVRMKLSPLVIGSLGLGIVCFHNCLDGIQSADLGAWGPAWKILHEQGMVTAGSAFALDVVYPLVPWVGVIALGYGFGALWERYPSRRAQYCVGLGVTSWTLFVLLRLFNIYGDGHPWTPQHSTFFTVLSYVNVGKYPPSLDYLLIFLGFALLFLFFIERGKKRWEILEVYGRVPLSYYILHLFLIHATAVAAAYVRAGRVATVDLMFHPPAGYGFSLGVVYGVWICMVALLYPICKRYGEIKRTSKSLILRYL
jgi:uncharacterized membrane protein